MFELLRKIPVDAVGIKGQIDSCEFSKDGALIAAADNHATAKVYDRATGTFIAQVRHIQLDNTEFMQEGKVNALGFSYDGQWLYTGINDRGLKLWRTDTWQQVHHLGDGNNVDAADFSANGEWFAMAAGKDVWIYAAADLTPLTQYSHTLGEVNNLDFSADGQYLVSCAGSGDSGDVRLVRTSDFTEVRSHAIAGSVKRVFFSPDGELYAAGARNQLTKVFRTEDGEEVANLVHRGSLVTLPGDDFSDVNVGIETLRFSHDGNYLLTGSVKDGTLRVFRRRDWSLVGYVQGQAQGRQIEYIDVSSDNELLVGGDEGVLYHFRFSPAPVLDAFEPLVAPAGLVAVEAEHPDTNLPQGGSRWESCSDTAASGQACLRAGPEAGRELTTGYQTFDPLVDSPKLDYRVAFGAAGTHYVWVRGRGAAGGRTVHVGLAEQELPSGRGVSFASAQNEWVWAAENSAGARVALQIPAPGEHTINLWMGEDGVEVDKLLITPDPDFVPVGLGADESPRGSLPQEPPAGGAAPQPPAAGAGGGSMSPLGGSPGSAGAPRSDDLGGSGPSAPGAAASAAPASAGCGCRSARASGDAPIALLLMLVALVRARARR